jgi:hypothetical protein
VILKGAEQLVHEALHCPHKTVGERDRISIVIEGQLPSMTDRRRDTVRERKNDMARADPPAFRTRLDRANLAGPVQEHPRVIQFIKRYALAEVAAVVGVPLAVLGVFLTALATRDTARQLESSNQQLRLAKAAAQPTFYLGYGPGSPRARLRSESTAQVPAYGRLILGMSGNAEDLSARAVSALIASEGDNTWIFAPVEPFSEVVPPAERTIQWTVSPVIVDREQFGLASELSLTTIIQVRYRDVFGEYQYRYFRLTDFPGRAARNESPTIHQPYVAQDAQLHRCMNSLDRFDLSKPGVRPGKIQTRKELRAASFKATEEDAKNCEFASPSPTGPFWPFDFFPVPPSDVSP